MTRIVWMLSIVVMALGGCPTGREIPSDAGDRSSTRPPDGSGAEGRIDGRADGVTPSDGTSCVGDKCVWVCTPNSKQCSGKTPQTCDATGAWQSGTACPYVCSGGSCTGTCAPNSKQCSGKTPQTCDATGAWQSAAACPYVCSGGSCTGSCAPSSKQCSGNTPQTCDASGTWKSGTTCGFSCSAGACVAATKGLFIRSTKYSTDYTKSAQFDFMVDTVDMYSLSYYGSNGFGLAGQFTGAKGLFIRSTKYSTDYTKSAQFDFMIDKVDMYSLSYYGSNGFGLAGMLY